MLDNPWTESGVWYPDSAKVLLAYHGIQGHQHGDGGLRGGTFDAEKSFRNIWKSGHLISSRQRQESGIASVGSMFFPLDVAAGDDRYIFLKPCLPPTVGEYGYNIVFDVKYLISQGALIGLVDFHTFYTDIAIKIDASSLSFTERWTKKEQIEFFNYALLLQSNYRLQGQPALQWVDWLLGQRKKFPINPRILKKVAAKIGAVYKDHTNELVTKDREEALHNAEVLVKDMVPLEWACGVIFRSSYYNIADFVQEYGPPGTVPPLEQSPGTEKQHAEFIEPRLGTPGRCPICNSWVRFRPLQLEQKVPEIRSMKHPKTGEKVIVYNCGSCGAIFHPRILESAPYFKKDEYLGNLADLETE